MSRFFKETCEELDLKACSEPDTQNHLYIDPCNCSTYYQCATSTSLLKRDCPPGTWFSYDDDDVTCVHTESKLFDYPCSSDDKPWERCNVSDSRLAELQALCTNTTAPFTTESPNSDDQKGDGTGNGVNAGMVVGLIIAGAALAVILIAVIVFYRRRRKRSQLQKGRPSVQNPEYFGKNYDDEYAVIDDSMNDPAYNFSTMGRPNGTMPLPPIPDEKVEYDNSGFTNKDSANNSDSIKPSDNEYERPISTTSTTPAGNVSVIHISMDVNGNRDKMDSSSTANTLT